MTSHTFQQLEKNGYIPEFRNVPSSQFSPIPSRSIIPTLKLCRSKLENSSIAFGLHPSIHFHVKTLFVESKWLNHYGLLRFFVTIQFVCTLYPVKTEKQITFKTICRLLIFQKYSKQHDHKTCSQIAPLYRTDISKEGF